MSPLVGRSENTVAPARKSYVRCSGCYARVVVETGGPAAAIYMHELSGHCSAHVPPKVRNPRKKKGEDDVRRPFFGGGFDG